MDRKTLNEEQLYLYNSLRNEIISIEEVQRNVWIYMYILFCTLFVLGLQWSKYLFLVTYIVLIPFQCVINDYSWSISKLSAFIRVFIESESDIKWESFHGYYPFTKYYKEKSNTIIGIIRVSGSVHLGLLATGFFCGYVIIETFVEYHFILPTFDLILMFLSIVLLFILIIVCKEFRKEYFYQLEPIMELYKKSIDRNE